ncbi:MAG TPA: hypothetical protein VFA50_14985 [Stellaceae bacterium]|nr:hypothetical protein [Stellaceae bacterium]
METGRWAEVASALHGAWRLACFDRAGLYFFARDAGALRRSFLAAVLVFPAFLILMPLRIPPEAWQHGHVLRILLVETIGYVVGWTAFPLIMLPVSRFLGREALWPGFIIAWNWSQVLQSGFVMAMLGLAGSGVVPAVGIGWLIEALVAVYEWFIARVALRLAAPPAALVVLIDLVTSELLSRLVAALR